MTDLRDLRPVLALLERELLDLSVQLKHLQDVPFLQVATGQETDSAALFRAMTALQDLDRMEQTAGALAIFAGCLSRPSAGEGTVSDAVHAALQAVPLRSVADRLGERLREPAPVSPSAATA